MEKVIDKKLHFGERKLGYDIIPQGIKEIGDWAYAQCGALEWLALPVSVALLGREVFRGCGALRYVYYYDSDTFSRTGLPEDVHRIAMLNALAIRCFPDPLSLLVPASGELKSRLDAWDRCCFAYLGQPDELGFEPFLAGGEEDYDENEEQLDSFRNMRQRLKAQAVYTRLLAEKNSSLPFDGEHRENFASFFRSCPEALPMLDRIDSHYEETAEIYAEAGLLTPETLQDALASLRPSNVKMRSALIRDMSTDPLGHLTL